MIRAISRLAVLFSLFFVASAAFAAGEKTSTTSCCCNTSISGTYHFFIAPAGGQSTGPFTARFATSGCTFKTTAGTSNGYRIYGTITGNQVNFTEVVDGEEAEGFARQVRGFARKTSANGAIIVGVFNDTDGVTGSWTASKVQ